jgi:hypothetical protein
MVNDTCKIKQLSNGLKPFALKFFLCFWSVSVVGQTVEMGVCLDQVSSNEPCISIDPHNPKYQIIGGNVDVYFLSQDSGQTWLKRELSSPYGAYGDPVVFISPSSRYYYAHLSKTKGKNFPEKFDRIVFQYSDNKGMDFDHSVAIGYHMDKVQDKPWFFVQPSPTNQPDQDMIVITWTEFDRYKSSFATDSSRIRFSVSVDGGGTFSDAITISTLQGGCMDDDNTPEGATPVVLSDGSIHVTWSMNEQIFYSMSLDTGRTWSNQLPIFSQRGGWSFSKKGFYRTNGLPFLQRGLNDELYLVWSSLVTDEMHSVFFSRSVDFGKTWSSPFALSKHDKTYDNDAFMPFINVDVSTGEILIIYYERPVHWDYFCHVSAVRSTDNGMSFSSFCVTDKPFLTPGESVFFGDYLSIASSMGLSRAVWTTHHQGKVFLCSSVPSTVNDRRELPFVLMDNRWDDQVFILVEKEPGISLKIRIKGKKWLKNATIVIPHASSGYDFLLPQFKRDEIKRIQMTYKGKNYRVYP